MRSNLLLILVLVFYITLSEYSLGEVIFKIEGNISGDIGYQHNKQDIIGSGSIDAAGNISKVNSSESDKKVEGVKWKVGDISPVSIWSSVILSGDVSTTSRLGVEYDGHFKFQDGSVSNLKEVYVAVSSRYGQLFLGQSSFAEEFMVVMGDDYDSGYNYADDYRGEGGIFSDKIRAYDEGYLEAILDKDLSENVVNKMMYVSPIVNGFSIGGYVAMNKDDDFFKSNSSSVNFSDSDSYGDLIYGLGVKYEKDLSRFYLQLEASGQVVSDSGSLVASKEELVRIGAGLEFGNLYVKSFYTMYNSDEGSGSKKLSDNEVIHTFDLSTKYAYGAYEIGASLTYSLANDYLYVKNRKADVLGVGAGLDVSLARGVKLKVLHVSYSQGRVEDFLSNSTSYKVDLKSNSYRINTGISIDF